MRVDMCVLYKSSRSKREGKASLIVMYSNDFSFTPLPTRENHVHYDLTIPPSYLLLHARAASGPARVRVLRPNVGSDALRPKINEELGVHRRKMRRRAASTGGGRVGATWRTCGRSSTRPWDCGGTRLPQPHEVITSHWKCSSKKNSSTSAAREGSDSRLSAMGISVSGWSISSCREGQGVGWRGWGGVGWEGGGGVSGGTHEVAGCCCWQ